jgi:hypothetical protein
MKTILLATFIAAVCAAQVTEQVPVDWRGDPPGSLFWVASAGTPNGATVPSFDFHWNTNANSGAPSRLQRYVVVIHFYQGKASNDKADPSHWLGFSLPAAAKGMSQADTTGTNFGPGAGPGPFHHYLFEFYALDAAVELPGDISVQYLQATMAPHTISHTTWEYRPAALE